MSYDLLDKISSPDDLKQLDEKKIEPLCAEIRDFLVEKVSHGAEQGILAAEIVIEGTAGCAGFPDDLLDGGVLVAVLVEQLPRRINDFAFCVPRGFHGVPPVCLMG